MASKDNAIDKPGPVARVTEFYEGVQTELEKVTWPSRADVKLNTQVTLMLLALMAALIFAFDQVFQSIVLLLLQLGT